MLFRKQTRSRALTGLFLDGQHMALATVEQVAGRRPRLTAAQSVDLVEGEDIGQRLRELVSASRTPANLVMADEHYQLLLVEAPRVEPSELRAAMRWKVKNLIDFHIDDAVIDVFEIPGQQNRPQGQAMMYAIAARSRDVRRHIDWCEAADVKLQIIDVTEMALRNLAAPLEDDVRGVATLYIGPEHGIITLTRQGSLYLGRRVAMGTRILDQGDDQAFEQLLLDIQRSLDYYDSHFSQPPLASLQILPGFEAHEALITYLNDGLNLTVTGFDARNIVDADDGLDPNQSPALLLALGGALRREEVSL